MKRESWLLLRKWADYLVMTLRHKYHADTYELLDFGNLIQTTNPKVGCRNYFLS